MWVATTALQANTPTGNPPTFAGSVQLFAIQSPGPGWTAPIPGPTVPLYHADLSGPAFAPGTPVLVGLSTGGHYYIQAAPGYLGLTAAEVAAQSGFSGF